jgi:hypothetical protein
MSQPLSNYRVRWLYRDSNGQLQLKVATYENQSTGLPTMVRECKGIADQNGWRLLDVIKLRTA